MIYMPERLSYAFRPKWFEACLLSRIQKYSISVIIGMNKWWCPLSVQINCHWINQLSYGTSQPKSLALTTRLRRPLITVCVCLQRILTRSMPNSIIDQDLIMKMESIISIVRKEKFLSGTQRILHIVRRGLRKRQWKYHLYARRQYSDAAANVPMYTNAGTVTKIHITESHPNALPWLTGSSGYVYLSI